MGFKAPRTPNPNLALLGRRATTVPPQRSSDAAYTSTQMHNTRDAKARGVPPTSRELVRHGAD